MTTCARCGKQTGEDARFCSYCAAPIKQPLPVSHKPPLREDLANTSTGVRLLLGALGILGALVCVLIVLMLNRPQEVTLLASASPQPDVSSPWGTPAAPATQPAQEDQPAQPLFTGAWIAERVEKNSKKVSPSVDTVLSEPRVQITFHPGGNASISYGGLQSVESITRTYTAEGESVYIDYGPEEIDGQQYYGRTRFFFKQGILYSVYLLDGREASDYTVFSPIPHSPADEDSYSIL